ncbi:MAG: xanthine dehydrogenase family protein molybdopterin-binding subunit, partial [Gammaproteobacteria bacterium]|nr:xanthine dehydrogenase family protein molybdopterin-binding subunit [Gammaproteobacteria bacterium]
MENATLTRRSFLKLSLSASALFIGGRHIVATANDDTDTPDTFVPNAWIRVDRNNTITFMIDKSEMGQGVMTSLAMLIAEEMEVDLDAIHTEFAPAEPVYANTLFGVQITGGSTSIPSSWDNLRSMGAAARTLFIKAAASHWNVPAGECYAESGRIHHGDSDRSISYGALIDTAAEQELPDKLPLKMPQQFRLIGKPVARLDTPAKVDGSARFAIDVELE